LKLLERLFIFTDVRIGVAMIINFFV
jgi:hypothetical protein